MGVSGFITSLMFASFFWLLHSSLRLRLGIEGNPTLHGVSAPLPRGAMVCTLYNTMNIFLVDPR